MNFDTLMYSSISIKAISALLAHFVFPCRWTGLGWETVAENEAPPRQPGALDHTTDAPGRWVFGDRLDDKAINVRMKPRHDPGKHEGQGELEADYLEVRIKYTQPPREAPPEPAP